MPAPRSAFFRGCSHGVAFLIVVVPFAMLFGALATDAGLSLVEVITFSAVVFAGASQFAALQLMQDHAPLLVILATTLAANLRLVMYSAAASWPGTGRQSRPPDRSFGHHCHRGDHPQPNVCYHRRWGHALRDALAFWPMTIAARLLPEPTGRHGFYRRCHR